MILFAFFEGVRGGDSEQIACVVQHLKCGCGIAWLIMARQGWETRAKVGRDPPACRCMSGIAANWLTGRIKVERSDACWVLRVLADPLLILPIPNVDHTITATSGESTVDRMKCDCIDREQSLHFAVILSMAFEGVLLLLNLVGIILGFVSEQSCNET